jgi:hypothetical protein
MSKVRGQDDFQPPKVLVEGVREGLDEDVSYLRDLWVLYGGPNEFK